MSLSVLVRMCVCQSMYADVTLSAMLLDGILMQAEGVRGGGRGGG
jgi:hypothetical protein